MKFLLLPPSILVPFSHLIWKWCWWSVFPTILWPSIDMKCSVICPDVEWSGKAWGSALSFQGCTVVQCTIVQCSAVYRSVSQCIAVHCLVLQCIKGNLWENSCVLAVRSRQLTACLSVNTQSVVGVSCL